MIIVADNTPGYELVRRSDGEPWVAIIHHPKGSRRWHVHYRTDARDTYKTRKAMLAALSQRFGGDNV